jgi:hypothetical protein
MKKRLLKDLPFGGLNAGIVLTKANGGYHVALGNTMYREGGESSNGWIVLSESEAAIVDMIWGNADWFVDARVNNLDFKVGKDNILVTFPSLDLEDAQVLAKGMKHCLIQFFGQEAQTYTWHKFKGFTISIH